MSIEQHFLSQDLTQLNEELLNVHNTSISIIKATQNGDFNNMDDYKKQIEKSIKNIEALHNKKIKLDGDTIAEYRMSNYF